MNLLKRVLISKEIVYHLKNKKNYLRNLLKKELMNFSFFLKKKISPNNLVYEYITEGRSPKVLVIIKIR